MVHNNMQNVFWGLKDNWWKQIYDGRVHKFGPDVFDKGLHDGDSEPGYYQSVKKASEYASQELGKPLTIEVYKKIHSIACEHFEQLTRGVINVDKENIHKFREKDNVSCGFDIAKAGFNHQDEDKLKIRERSFHLLKLYVRDIYYHCKIDITGENKEELRRVPRDIRERYTKNYAYYSKDGVNVADTIENGCPFLDEPRESIKQIRNQLVETQKRFGVPKPFSFVRLVDTTLKCEYNYENPIEIEKIVNMLIDDYNKKMSTLPLDLSQRNNEQNEQALTYIAELFQNLEWLHPFYDGQGRTDLVLLSKLLTENGYNPSILYCPYFSTFEPLAKWVSYLKAGINEWKKESNQLPQINEHS